MRSTCLVVAVSMTVPLAAAPAPADPGDQGNLKLWVQSPEDASMLHDLVTGDSRFHPIVRVSMNGFLTQGINGMSDPCVADPTMNAQCIAQTAFNIAQSVIGTSDPNGLAIMLQGFGQGGRPDSGPGWGNSLALAHPGDRLTTPNSDWTLAPNPGTSNSPISHLTPWFDFGTQDCAIWLQAFAADYKALVELHHPDTEAFFQPTRFVFDLEIQAGLCCAGQFADAVTIRDFTVNPSGHGQTDSRSLINPIYGFPNFLGGMTLDDLNQSFFGTDDTPPPPSNQRRWPCDGCDSTNLLSYDKMLWVNNVNSQAQLAALGRSLRLNFADPMNPTVENSAKSILEGMSPAGVNHRSLLYTQYNEVGTDGMVNDGFPPYDWNGHPLRKVGYRDVNFHNTDYPNLSYTALNQIADFGSSVFYAFPRGLNGRLYKGQSNEDWVIQDARERLESALFTRIIHGSEMPPFWLTPWVAGVNQYFVNMDFHRRLLALCRAKDCHEFNVFVGANAATPGQTMHNWTMFRHLLDQVYGFDVNPTGGTIVGTDPGSVGNPAQTDYSVLAMGDFFTMDVTAVPENPAGTQPNNPYYLAEIQPVFTVSPAFGTTAPSNPSDPAFWQSPFFAIRNSAKLRVNLEISVEATGPGPTPLDGSDFFTPSVVIHNQTNNTWVPVQMSSVVPGHGSSIKGSRYIMAGVVSNMTGGANSVPGVLVNWPVNGSTPAATGTVEVAVSLTSGYAFTAHFDLVQVVGMDANDSELDWNHDGVVDGNDLLAFASDFGHFWTSNGTPHPAPAGSAMAALDFNNDGVISPADVCAFHDRLWSAGLLSPTFAPQFQAICQSFGFTCNTQDGSGGGQN